MNLDDLKERVKDILHQHDCEGTISPYMPPRIALTISELQDFIQHCHNLLIEYPNLAQRDSAYSMIAQHVTRLLTQSRAMYNHGTKIVDILNQHPWIVTYYMHFYASFFEANTYDVGDDLLISVYRHLEKQNNIDIPASHRTLRRRLIALHRDPWFLLATESPKLVTPRNFLAWKASHFIQPDQMSMAAKIVGYYLDEFCPQDHQEQFLLEQISNYSLPDALRIIHKPVSALSETTLFF